MVALGIAGLVAGAELVVRAAVEIACDLGVSELLIGMTVVAVGTSLPELAAAAAAARRGESDLVLGNIIGSNTFNVLFILGTTAVVAPVRVADRAVGNELPVMVGFSAALYLVVLNGLRVYRWEGVGLLAAYAGFVNWQVAAAGK